MREVLRSQGRSVAWLARQIGRRDSYVRGVVADHWPATADFRERCAKALQLPEQVLFHDGSGAPHGGRESRAEPAEGDALYATPGVAVY